METRDMDLLRQYAREGSEAAFTELVRRHVALVYSAALRQVRSLQLAEEIAQSVFTDLARNAERLAPDTVFAAWLYKVTRRTAVDVIRRETRRRAREHAAVEWNAMNAPETDWSQIEPLLDQAMCALNETDRAALLLRYFENRSLREVGETLGTSEDAAQKRISRAVERLRASLARSGVTVGARGLVLTLVEHSTASTDHLVASSLATAALHGAASPTAAMGAGFVGWMKTKTGIAISVSVVAIAATGLLLEAARARAGRNHLPTGSGTPRIAMGAAHGIILASDGSLWSWGTNFAGWPVLGLGAVDFQSSLRPISSDTGWIDVASSFTHALALKEDGTIWGWGDNINGQLGGTTSERRSPPPSTPVPAVPGNDWVAVAAGGSRNLAIRRDGTLWAWGNNWAGQLGVGVTNQEIREPLQVGTNSNWKKIWAGGLQTAGLQTDGTLWFWGSLTGESQDTNRVPVPTRISADTNWIEASFGYFVVFAIKSDGTLWAWGRNAGIYTGSPIQLLNPTPARVGTNSDWVSCSSSEYFYRVLKKRDGSLWALDASDYAFVNRTNYAPVTLTPIPLPKGILAFGAASRDRTGVALTAEGEVWTWGETLGDYTPGRPLLKTMAGWMGWKTTRFDGKRIRHEKPTILPVKD